MRAMYARVSSTDVSLPSSISLTAVGPSSVSRFRSAADAGAAVTARARTRPRAAVPRLERVSWPSGGWRPYWRFTLDRMSRFELDRQGVEQSVDPVWPLSSSAPAWPRQASIRAGAALVLTMGSSEKRGPRTRSVVIATTILVLGIAPFGVAATGDALREGVRNGTATKETEIISSNPATTTPTGGYATRQSNKSDQRRRRRLRLPLDRRRLGRQPAEEPVPPREQPVHRLRVRVQRHGRARAPA